MKHEIVLAELDKQIDLLSNQVYSESNSSFDTNIGPVVNQQGVHEEKTNDINDINGILSALENCQIKIQELEKEKSESKSQIKSLEQELNSARQLLFLKSSSEKETAEPLYKSESLEKLQKLKSNWIQDARNEVEELRKKVDMEKRRQSLRLSIDKSLHSIASETIDEESVGANPNFRDSFSANPNFGNSFSLGENQDFLEKSTMGDYYSKESKEPKIKVDTIKLEPPVKAHIRSPSDSPVRAGLDRGPVGLEMENDYGFLKREQIGQLKEQILSTRKSQTKENTLKKEKLKVYPPKPPAWKNVQGRPKSAAVSSSNSGKTGSRQPHSSKLSRTTLERSLPFTVGQNPGKSYSVTANIQKVYSLLKSHNPSICSACSDKSCDSKCQNPKSVKSKGTLEKEIIPKNQIVVNSGSSQSILTSNLYTLEKEFESLKEEYNTLVTKYDSALCDSSKKSTISLKEIGNNLKHIIQTMETKSDQIAILTQIMETAKKSTYKKTRPSRPTRPSSPCKALENLGLLKNSRIVQDSLL